MSVRKIKKSYISCVGYFRSYKNNGQLAFESILERDFFTILELDSSVVSYEEQPFQIKYDFNGSIAKYTPDVLVQYKDSSQKVFEVKYQQELDSDAALQYKLSFLKEEIRRQKSFTFEIFTDAQLSKTYLKNCIFLYKYAFLLENSSIRASIRQAIKNQQKPLSAKAFLEILSTDQNEQLKMLPYLWREIFNNTSLVDMNQPITMLSLLHTGNHYE